MCGRYSLTADTATLQTRFATTNTLPELQPRYNIAPTQELPVVVRELANSLVLMRWGLIPFWAKDPGIGNRLINARAETLAEKPAFRHALRTQRCLVPADAFYEWQRTSTGKVPYALQLQDRAVFAFAGLYDTWRDSDGTPIQSYTIITTAPNDLVATVHNRMPAILPRAAEDIWLDPQLTDPAELLSLLKPYPAQTMAAYPVSPIVNNPSNDSPAALTPLGQQA